MGNWLPNWGRRRPAAPETVPPATTEVDPAASALPPDAASSSLESPETKPPVTTSLPPVYSASAHQVFEATIDANGQITLDSPAAFTGTRRALVVVLAEERPSIGSLDAMHQTAGQSEGSHSDGHERYRIDGRLGAGGMGETYIGTDLRTKATICLKRLRVGLGEEVFEQEWRSLSRVDSRYVARFLDRFHFGGAWHLVMEYVNGPTLARRLETGLTCREAVWLGAKLFRGVQAIHEHRVIHCDLKPANVLIDGVGEPQDALPWTPKIIDFGLAVLDDLDADGRATGAGRVAGTPAYMAPEQVLGAMLSPACDVYAAGVIMWEAITGRYAFSGTVREILAGKSQQHTGLHVEPFPKGLPVAANDLIARCTDPRPEGRPTAAEAARAFESWLDAATLDPLPGWRSDPNNDLRT